MRRHLGRSLVLALPFAIALVACDDRGVPDASIDAGSADAGDRDAGSFDAGDRDASTDAGPDGGGCPADCLPPDHASADCSSGACDFACDADYVRRGDACIEALGCTPGLLDTTRITDTGNGNVQPTVAVSGDVAAVFWIQGAFGDNTRAVDARFYDYPAMTPRTDVQVVASAALYLTNRIEIVPVSGGFAVAYDRVDYTYGGIRCHVDFFDRDGVRTLGSSSSTVDGCSRFAFGGGDAGLALAYGAAPLDARRFDAMGSVVTGSATTRISDVGSAFGANHLAFDPDTGEHRVAYQIYRSAGNVEVLSATLSTTGFRTTVDTLAVTGFNIVQNVELAYANGRYGLIFEGEVIPDSGYERWLVVLGADGTPTSSPISMGASTRAALAAGPYELGVVLGKSYDVTLEVRDAAGAPVGAPIDVATGPSDADTPDVAWAGDGFVVAYSDDIAGSGLDDVYLARVCPAR